MSSRSRFAHGERLCELLVLAGHSIERFRLSSLKYERNAPLFWATSLSRCVPEQEAIQDPNKYFTDLAKRLYDEDRDRHEALEPSDSTFTAKSDSAISQDAQRQYRKPSTEKPHKSGAISGLRERLKSLQSWNIALAEESARLIRSLQVSGPMAAVVPMVSRDFACNSDNSYSTMDLGLISDAFIQVRPLPSFDYMI